MTTFPEIIKISSVCHKAVPTVNTLKIGTPKNEVKVLKLNSLVFLLCGNAY